MLCVIMSGTMVLWEMEAPTIVGVVASLGWFRAAVPFLRLPVRINGLSAMAHGE